MGLIDSELSRRGLIQLSLGLMSLSLVGAGVKFMHDELVVEDQKLANAIAALSPDERQQMVDFRRFIIQTFRQTADPEFWSRIREDSGIYKQDLNYEVFKTLPLVSPRQSTDARSFLPGLTYQLNLPPEESLPEVGLAMDVQGKVPTTLMIFCNIGKDYKFGIEPVIPISNLDVKQYTNLQEELLAEAEDFSPKVFVRNFSWNPIEQPPNVLLSKDDYLIAAVSAERPYTSIYWGANRNFKITTNLL